jgi:hypothetical protein
VPRPTLVMTAKRRTQPREQPKAGETNGWWPPVKGCADAWKSGRVKENDSRWGYPTPDP